MPYSIYTRVLSIACPDRFKIVLPLLTMFISCFGFCSSNFAIDEKFPKPREIKHQITGLFSPDREQDLRDLFAKLPQFQLKSIDYANAEVVLEYDPKKVFPEGKPEQLIENLDNLLRGASRSTFGVKSLRTIPLEKLKRIEIPVAGLDCKGCAFATYQMIYQLPGVENATVSFKMGKVIALVNPEKIKPEEIIKILKQGGVEIKTPVK